MKNFNVTSIYFSPTETSKKGANEIAKTINPDFLQIDLTRINQEISKTIFDKDDLVVFGAPVYGGRLFKGVIDRFNKIKGNDTPCIITVTYGNRDFDDALIEFYDLVIENGFIPIAASTLVGEHTFGKIQLGRPNEQDLSQDRDFALKVIEKLENTIEKITVPGNRPYKDGGNGGKFRPSTNQNCVECGICAKLCPQQVILYDNYSNIDVNGCISCFSCIKHCPVNAKVMDTKEYISFAEDFTKKLEKPCENQYFV